MKPPGSNRFKIELSREELFPGKTKSQLEGYDAGHIHADAHNARPDLAENFVPIDSKFNQGAMRDFEMEVRDIALQGKTVEYRKYFDYDPSDNIIPKTVRLECFVDGKLFKSISHNNWRNGNLP